MKLTVGLGPGSVAYSRSEAEIPIEDLIAALEEAKEDGATHVVGLSGNYRGAKYTHVSTELEFLD